MSLKQSLELYKEILNSVFKPWDSCLHIFAFITHSDQVYLAVIIKLFSTQCRGVNDGLILQANKTSVSKNCISTEKKKKSSLLLSKRNVVLRIVRYFCFIACKPAH